MFRLPPFVKRVFLNLTAITIAALVTAIAACSSNNENPTPQQAMAERVNQLSTEVASLRESTNAPAPTEASWATPPYAATPQPAQTMMPQATDERPMQTIEAMAQEIAALQTKVAVPTETAESDEPEQTSQPAPTKSAATPQPTPAPAQVVIPTPTGPGICGRSPAVQEAILHTLRTTSCRLVSAEELYRITKFRDLRGDFYQPKWPMLQAGDLDGLFNLEELTVRGDLDLPPNTFAGAGIKRLTLSGVTLSPDAFEGMIFLDSLHIKYTEDFPTLNAKVFTGLRELSIDFNIYPLPDLTGDELKQLTNLRQVRIRGYISKRLSKGDRPGRVYRIPEDLFRNNGKLRSVHIRSKLG